MKNVLLLRAPEEDGRDRYEVAFKTRGYVPLSVPVLKTELVNVDALRDRVLHGPEAGGLSGVILTSKRTVEAWCVALRSIEEMTRMKADWRTVPFYVVGEATAGAVRQVHRAFPSRISLAPAETQVRGGAEAGTGERLAAFILGEREGEGGQMLYLTGDKNRETLPKILASGGVALETLQVYRTVGSSTFRVDLEAALVKAPVDGDVEWGWVVHFAPSAAVCVTPVLNDVFGSRVKVAAIGATTGTFLRDELGVEVDVIAPKPTAEELCGAIANWRST